jgi:hypothetical protein
MKLTLQIFTATGKLRFIEQISPDWKAIKVRGRDGKYWYLIEGGYIKAWRKYPEGKWHEWEQELLDKMLCSS